MNPPTQLTKSELQSIDFRAMGNVILKRTINLSHQVNEEILRPISNWLDDPDFMKKFEINMNDNPNWAEYKKKQREWTEQQKQIAAERQKLYWQEIHKKQRFRKELTAIFGGKSNCTQQQPETTENSSDNNFRPSIYHIVAPFSPREQHKNQIEFEFTEALHKSISSLLPWRLLITTDLQEGATSFTDLTTHCPKNKKADKIAKFQHLLQMDADRIINLSQRSPTEDIHIQPTNELNPITEIQIKDQQGKIYDFDWQTLSDAQKSKVITDTLNRKILCKT